MSDPGEQILHRMVLEALPLGVYVVNREGKIILWSAGAEQLTGYLRQDVLGRLREEELWEEAGNENETAREGFVRPVESLPEGHAVRSAPCVENMAGCFSCSCRAWPSATIWASS